VKTRNGFVSNSSSSSFVAVGIKLTKEDIEAIDKIKPAKSDSGWEFDSVEEYLYEEVSGNNKIRVLIGSEDGVKDNEVVLAKMIAEISSEDSYIKDMEFSAEEMLALINTLPEGIIKALEKHGLDPVGRKASLFIGTRGC